jgi:small subunit ribosomal protein S17
MAVKEKIGIVVSDKMQDTKIVAVNDRVTHKRYSKVITRTKRYAAHDSRINASVGDTVKIREIAPLSKTKNWVLTSVLGKTKT